MTNREGELLVLIDLPETDSDPENILMVVEIDEGNPRNLAQLRTSDWWVGDSGDRFRRMELPSQYREYLRGRVRPVVVELPGYFSVECKLHTSTADHADLDVYACRHSWVHGAWE